MPCIIHWNFNHFVVLEGIDGGRVYINDPGDGAARASTWTELDVAFTGVVLAMEPTAEFRKVGEQAARPAGSAVASLRASQAAVRLLLLVSLALVDSRHRHPGLQQDFRRPDSDRAVCSGWFRPLLIGMARDRRSFAPA